MAKTMQAVALLVSIVHATGCIVKRRFQIRWGIPAFLVYKASPMFYNEFQSVFIPYPCQILDAWQATYR